MFEGADTPPLNTLILFTDNGNPDQNMDVDSLRESDDLKERLGIAHPLQEPDDGESA